MHKNTLTDVMEAAIRITGRKFCSHHMGHVDVHAGSVVVKNRSRRFVCFRCQQNIAERDATLAAMRSQRDGIARIPKSN